MNIDKAALRQNLKQRRDAFSIEQRLKASIDVSRVLSEWLDQSNVTSIFGYLALGSELNLNEFFTAAQKKIRVFVPRVTSKGCMEFCELNSSQAFVKNRFGIDEPLAGAETGIPTLDSLVLLPCLAVTRKGSRLGYGGGYYDRYFSRSPKSFLCGVSYDETIIDSIPMENHDIPLDAVVSPNGIIRIVK